MARVEVAIVGAGLHGLATAWHLGRLGCRRVALFERFRIGHDRGSSHGSGRITRSSYDREIYVRLMRVAHGEEWPRLERDSGRTLIHRCDGCFFGPADGPFEDYARAVAAVGVDVERLEVGEARRRFPAFRFPDAAGVLHDRTAGVVAAADTIAALAALCRSAGVAIHEETVVEGFDPSGESIRVRTSRGPFDAERLVVAAGPWAGRLLPLLAGRLATLRQTVGYFRMATRREEWAPGRFPVWVHLGAGPNGLYYGLPEFGRDGIKIGRHVTSGAGDDPDRPGTPAEDQLEGMRRFLERQLVPAVDRLVGAETCFYTVTPREDYLIDVHPSDPRIVIGAGFSGHGFKLGPVTGRVLAELALLGRSTIPEFDAARAAFSIQSVLANAG